MKKLALLILAICCVACSTNKPGPLPALPGWPVVPVPVDAAPVRVLQQLDARFLGRHEQFQSVIEIGPGKMQVILLAAGGQRLATISLVDDRPQAEVAVKLPVELPLMQILETIQLVYFPLEQLNAHLLHEHDAKWQISQSGLERQVFFQKKLYAQIVYTGADPWSSRTDYQNLAHDYAFTIDSGRLP